MFEPSKLNILLLFLDCYLFNITHINYIISPILNETFWEFDPTSTLLLEPLKTTFDGTQFLEIHLFYYVNHSQLNSKFLF